MNTNKSIVIIITVVLLAVMCGTLAACKPAEEQLPPQVDPIDDNYRVFYQIFVGSFSDSDGDGVGDLRGIINRLDYLNDGNINSGKSLGVQGLWLSPIFTSPTYHKYDASDYYTIDSRFGTQADLEELIEKCHQRNVKVILDLAINHTSTQHAWFQNFRTARAAGAIDNPFYDWYSCVDDAGKISGCTYYPVQGASGWYYEANFDSGMPELNYDNEAVREAMVDVAKHYLDMGIDGFRFDAVKYIYYGNTQSSVAFWEWYMQQLRAIKPDIYTVGECWSGDGEVVEYYSALNCFNFTTAKSEGFICDAVRKNHTARFANYLQTYLQSIKAKNPDAMYMPFLANHDMDRAAGYVTVSSGNAYMAANMYLLCSGSPTIYYGEEIGMKGTRGASNTDSNRRLAMLWGDGDTVRNPVGATFAASSQINGTVNDQLGDKGSLLNYYAKVIAMRNKYPAIARGEYTALSVSAEEVGGWSIDYEGNKIALLHNTDPNQTVRIAVPTGFSAVADSIGFGSAVIKDGMLEIGPQTSVILK